MSNRVLLVDDEPGIRKVLSIYLKDAGYEVHTAEDGFSASKMLENLKPDIVLTDIKMPGTDGLDLLNIIKARDIPTEVIMITGHGNMNMVIESLKMGAVDFITKPIDNACLDIALKRAKEKRLLLKTLYEYKQVFEALTREKIQNSDATEQRHARFFNESPSYIAILDRNFTIVDCNNVFREQFEPYPEMKCYEAYNYSKKPCTNCPVQKSYNDGKSHTFEKDVTLSDRNIRHFFIQTSPMVGLDGQVQFVMEMSTDITCTRL